MTRMRPLDAELWRRCPDADAVRALYERHVDAVFRFAVRRCRNPEDVADLVSAVFSELFSAAAGYDRHRGEVRAWLLGIAARCLADRRRSEYRRAELVAPTRRQQNGRSLSNSRQPSKRCSSSWPMIGCRWPTPRGRSDSAQ